MALWNLYSTTQRIAGYEKFAGEKKNTIAGYDYSQPGYYFVTICVKDKHEMLGKVVGAASCRPQNPASIQLTDYGEIVANEIVKLSSTYNHVTVNKYVIMPNHVQQSGIAGGSMPPLRWRE